MVVPLLIVLRLRTLPTLNILLTFNALLTKTIQNTNIYISREENATAENGLRRPLLDVNADMEVLHF
jgi:hypothetical protein